MSKRIHIELEDAVAVKVAHESALLGLSAEDYISRAVAQQALRDKLKRADDEGGELRGDDVFTPLIEKYQAMTDK